MINSDMIDSMNIRKRLGGLVLAGVFALTATAVAVGPAHAGTNGQQLLLINNSGTNDSFLLKGTDYNGNPVQTCVNTDGRWETWFSNWWFKGSLTYFTYTAYNCYGTPSNWGAVVNIPTSSSNDWQAITDNSSSYGGNQQIDFFDNLHKANSIRISGYNQYDQNVSGCWATPGWETPVNGWWWQTPVTITTYASTNCSGSSNGVYTPERVGNPNNAWFGFADS
jgi:hypothetical protein